VDRAGSLDGGSYDVAQDRGKVLVVNFWGSLVQPVPGRGRGPGETVSGDEGQGRHVRGREHPRRPGSAKAFERGRTTYPSIYDPDGKVALTFDVTQVSTPSTLILDRPGPDRDRAAPVHHVRSAGTVVERVAAEGNG